jgi:WD40 repeat protein
MRVFPRIWLLRQVAELEYDAFISYSHEHDLALGPALQAGLERFAKPWYRPRALRVFRDAANLPASPALWKSIEEALRSSRWFILLASPNASRSLWVNREVQWWLDQHGTDRLLVVATGSGLSWDERAQDWTSSTAVPPALRHAFTSEPRWVDLTNMPWHHRLPVVPAERLAEVAAAIRGVPKDTLFGDHLVRHKQAMRLAWTAIAFLLALTIGLAAVVVIAIYARQQAISERNSAISAQLISQSESIGDTNPALSRLLSVAAWHIDPTNAARYAMLTAAALPGTAILAGQTGDPVTTVAFSPGGTMLADITLFSDVRLWDVATHRQLRTPFPRNTEIDAVAFSPDSKILAGADTGDGIVRLWDIAANRQVETLVVKETDSTDTLAFSPDGRILAVGYGGGWVRLWDVATGRQIGTPMKSPSDPATAVAFNPDGKTLAVADETGTIQFWDVATQQRASKPMQAGAPLAFSPDGSLLSSVDSSDSLTLWDVVTGQRVSPLDGYTGGLDSVAFSPDSQILATASKDGTVQLWDVATRQEIGNPLDSGAGSVESVAFSPDGQSLATGNYDGTVRLWNVARLLGTTTLTSSDISHSPVGALAFSPNGQILASANKTGTVLWDTATGRPVGAPLIPADGPAENGTVAFSPDGRIVATAIENDIQLWDAVTGRLLGRLRPGVWNGGAASTPLAFSPDGELLAVGSNFSDVWLFNVASHAKVATLSDHSQWGFGGVAFSPNGRILAATSTIGTFLWNTATWKPMGHVLGALDSDNMSIAFSPDGRRLAVSGGNKVQVWDVANWTQIGDPFINTESSGENEVTSVAFSTDGQTLAVGTASGSVQLYLVATTQQIGEPLPASGNPDVPVTAVAFDPSGRFLAVGNNNGSVQIWNMSYLTDVVPRLCASAGQPLTRAEWAVYIHGLAYENVCP